MRRAELEVAFEMSHKFDNKLRDVSGRLDEISSNVETQCERPGDHEVEELQQHIIQQKVAFRQQFCFCSFEGFFFVHYVYCTRFL